MATGEQFEDGRGKHMIIPISDWRKQAYLEWLCTPPKEREPKTKSEFAKTIDMDRRTLSNWQNEPEFLKEWEKTYLQTIGSPERKSEIMDTLFKTATDPDDPKHVAAAKEYFSIEGSLKPQKMDVKVSRDPDELTDEALDAMIAAYAQSKKDERERSS
jgi:hypothetical protein